MSYYIAKTSSRAFDVVVADVVERLKAEGFGACNPHLAHEALKLENKLGVLLPCNVIVRETPDRHVEVASVDPVTAMERTGNPALASTAQEVRRRLLNALSAVAP